MFQICMHMAETVISAGKRFAATPVGVFLYGVIPGIIGILILLGFLSTVLSTQLLPVILPIIIGFNSAAGGYGIVDKGGEKYPFLKTALLTLALLLTVAGNLGLVLFCPWEPLLDAQRWFIATFSSTLLCFFGAWIATKNRSLNQPGRSTIQYEEG